MESSVISAVNPPVSPAFLLLLRENKKRDLEVSDLFFSDELLPILDKNDKCRIRRFGDYIGFLRSYLVKAENIFLKFHRRSANH